MRILSISSQVAHGPVGNSAAVPALQARGHEVLAVPTVMLSNHPGHGTFSGFHIKPGDMANILGTLDELGALGGCAAVMTGYFASPEQIEVTATVITRMKARNPDLYVLIDPVMGDDGAFYVPEAVAASVRGRLAPLATCITPNRFELEYLSGETVDDEAAALAAARGLAIPEVLATSIPAPGGQLATLLVMDGICHRATALRLDSVPNGTGDLVSGLYLATRLTDGPEAAFAAAMRGIGRAIARSVGTTILDVAGALHGP